MLITVGLLIQFGKRRVRQEYQAAGVKDVPVDLQGFWVLASQRHAEICRLFLGYAGFCFS